MAATIENINGFQLYENASTVDNTPYDGAWVTIIKNKNELPYAKIRCAVLYWKNNTSPTTEVMFYRKRDSNNKVRQHGWMRGFPLFNIGDMTNWPVFSAADPSWNGGTPPSTFYTPPTLDLTSTADTKKNLIVLDFQNLPKNRKTKEYLRGDLKYLVLRLKRSEESAGKQITNPATRNKYGIAWQRWWYEYTYYCDIVNPSECLDFNTNLFRMNEDSGAASSGTDHPLPWWIDDEENFANTYTNLSANILLYPNRQDVEDGKEPPYGGADAPPNTNNKRPGYFQLCVNQKNTLAVGNFQKYWDVAIAGAVTTYPQDLYDPTSPDPAGWAKETIKLFSTTQLNTFENKNYTFKNLLWCSVQSPMWMDLSLNGVGGEPSIFNSRYIVNFEDISGGYGRDANTIDMVRGTTDPYFSSTANNAVNNDTNDAFDATAGAAVQYASHEQPGYTDFYTSNYYDIWLKLLIPPKSGNTVSVKYSFGQDVSSVVTFWRGKDPSNATINCCDGIPDPVGIDESTKAVRKHESLTLEWKSDDVSTTGDIRIQRIRLIDVASGAYKNTPEITDGSGELVFGDLNTNASLYDISTNIFQIRLRDGAYLTQPGEDGYDQTRAMIQNFNIAEGEEVAHTFFIDLVPKNYIPYRMYPYTTQGSDYYNIPPTVDWNTSDPQLSNKLFFNPWKIISDPLEYGAIGDQQENATLVRPTNNKYLFVSATGEGPATEESEEISFSTVIDNSFNLYLTKNITSEQEQGFKGIILGKLNNSPPDTPLTIEPYNPSSGNPPVKDKRNRTNPTTLRQGNLFISDYWQWNRKLWSLGDQASSITKDSQNLKLFASQLTCAGVVDPVNVQVDQQYMLINTVVGSTNQINIGFPTSSPAESNTNTTAKIVFVGGDSVDPPISETAAIMKLELTGVTLPNITGETEWPTSLTFDKEETNEDFAALFRAKNEYITRTTDASRNRWNKLYELTVTGENTTANNENFRNMKAVPRPIYINAVELPVPEHENDGKMLNSTNTKVTIIWKKYYFDNTTQGDIYWTIKRTNTITLKTLTLLNDATITPLGDYRFVDSDIRIYDKYYYELTGVFKWKSEGLSTPLPVSLGIPLGGFTSTPLIVCINNQFPYGRYNTTSTNLKLYRPLLLTAAEGQCSEVDEFGNTSGRCVGGICRGLVDGKLINLYNPGRSNGGTRNIYANVTNQLTNKQVYVLLAKSLSRPFR